MYLDYINDVIITLLIPLGYIQAIKRYITYNERNCVKLYIYLIKYWKKGLKSKGLFF